MRQSINYILQFAYTSPAPRYGTNTCNDELALKPTLLHWSSKFNSTMTKLNQYLPE